jgi:shikimate kinase
MPLVLIGYRGVGKTTVAKRLALALGWEWVDSDAEIERRAGKPIATIFAEEGEPSFRDLEAMVLDDLSNRRLVIAAGGGIVIRKENRALLKERATVVWLTADAETIHQRLASDPTTATRRPNLTGKPDREEIAHLLATREPLYRACADCVINTVGRSPEEVAGEIIDRLRLASEPP